MITAISLGTVTVVAMFALLLFFVVSRRSRPVALRAQPSTMGAGVRRGAKRTAGSLDD